MSRPTRPQTAEYIIAVGNLTKVLTEAWSLIVLEPANLRREVSRLLAELREFQLRFNVAIRLLVGDSLLSTGSVFWCSAAPAYQTPTEKFVQTLPQVSIISLLDEDNIVPKCNICRNPFAEQLAQASLTNNSGENQPGITEVPAETAESDVFIEIPVQLPCGHVFGKKCISSWITSCIDSHPPTCPSCRVVVEGFEAPVPRAGRDFYEEVIKVLCPQILDSDLDMDEVLDLLVGNGG